MAATASLSCAIRLPSRATRPTPSGRARRTRIRCIRTSGAPAHICTGTGLTPCHICTGIRVPLPTTALHRGLAHSTHVCAGLRLGFRWRKWPLEVSVGSFRRAMDTGTDAYSALVHARSSTHALTAVTRTLDACTNTQEQSAPRFRPRVPYSTLQYPRVLTRARTMQVRKRERSARIRLRPRVGQGTHHL